MAFVDDPEQESAEVARGVWLLMKRDEAANRGDLHRAVAAENLLRSLSEEARLASRQRLERRDDTGQTAFRGEGHRLSDWTFESDEERDRERRAAMETAQARYSAGLAPFEGERDISRVPSAPTTEEPSPPRLPSDLESAIRSRRRFSSGATEAEVDPVGHIENELIPSDPNHATLKSELRKRREQSSGASDEYVDVKAASRAYRKEVEAAIKLHAKEQPRTVGELRRLWEWINEEIDDNPDELRHRARQVPRIEELLRTIKTAAEDTEARRRDAKEKHEAATAKEKQERIDVLMLEIANLSREVKRFFERHHGTLSKNREWEPKYQGALGYFDIVQKDSASRTEENLGDLGETWRQLRRDALGIVDAAGGPRAAVKIGYDPFDEADKATIYGYYQQAGGQALIGHVMTVCQGAEKYGGTYTYKGKKYDMYHDSHGAKEADPVFSRTAWKIVIDDRLQVVGIGRHIAGSANYRVIFPYSTDPSVHDSPPSPDIVDRRE